MSTNLTSVSTYGWWTGATGGQDVQDELTPISTYGWWVMITTLGRPDIIEFDVYIQQILSNTLYVDQMKTWSMER